MTDTEASKRLAQRFVDTFSSGDVEQWAALLDDDVSYQIMGSSPMSGNWRKADMVAAYQGMFALLPQGIRMECHSLIAEGDRVAMEMRGYATTVDGRPYNNRYHVMFHIRDGRIIEAHEYFDTKLVDEVFGTTPNGGEAT